MTMATAGEMTGNKAEYGDDLVAVTGASRGLGASIAVELAKAGFRVGCLSRRGAGVESIEVPGGLQERMINLACDVTDQDGIARSLVTLDGERGGLRCLINNAGIHRLGSSARFGNEDFEQILRTNVIGTFAMCRAAYPYLCARGGGAIINIGSFFDRLGVPRNTAYGASKAALGSITRSLAAEWARDGIAVINVAPGYIETDLNHDYLARDEVKAYFARRVSIARPGQPEEVADFIVRLLGGDLTLLTGQTIYLDGGHAIDHGRI